MSTNPPPPPVPSLIADWSPNARYLIAGNENEYVRIAIDLARDIPKLKQLRRTLRDRMKHSPLMDATRFARNIEALYRKMWQSRCAGDTLQSAKAVQG